MRSSEKWTILAGLWTIKLGRQNGRLLHWRNCSCVSTNTKHWKLLLASQPFVRQVDCAVARQNFSLIATAHDCETVFLNGAVKTKELIRWFLYKNFRLTLLILASCWLNFFY